MGTSAGTSRARRREDGHACGGGGMRKIAGPRAPGRQQVLVVPSVGSTLLRRARIIRSKSDGPECKLAGTPSPPTPFIRGK
jgi:hypothetical protein